MANYPPGWRYPEPSACPPGQSGPAPVARPASVRRAVFLLCAGAAIAVVKGTLDGLTTNNVDFYSYGSASPGTATVHQSSSLAAGVIMGIIEGGLWLWMAWKTGAGRRWARVLCGVFFGFSCLMLIGGFSTLTGSGGKLVTLVVLVAGWVVGLTGLIQLWQREASQFFASG
jgi:hypothetical protein